MNRQTPEVAAVAASADEAWALAIGLPGFVPAVVLDAHAAAVAEIERIREEVAALELRRADIAAELAAARQAAFDDARAAASESTAAAIAGLVAQGTWLKQVAVDAVLQSAEAIVRECVAVDPAAVRRMVRAAIARRTSTAPIGLRVAPAASDVVGSMAELAAMRVVVDATLGPGDLVVEYTDGQIDLRLHRLLDRLRGALESTLTAPEHDE